MCFGRLSLQVATKFVVPPPSPPPPDAFFQRWRAIAGGSSHIWLKQAESSQLLCCKNTAAWAEDYQHRSQHGRPCVPPRQDGDWLASALLEPDRPTCCRAAAQAERAGDEADAAVARRHRVCAGRAEARGPAGLRPAAGERRRRRQLLLCTTRPAAAAGAACASSMCYSATSIVLIHLKGLAAALDIGFQTVRVITRGLPGRDTH